MTKKLITVLIFLAASTQTFAVLPYTNNADQGQKPTSFQALAVGNLYDNTNGSGQATLGVPVWPTTIYALDAPAAADTDHFYNDLNVTSTGSYVPNVTNVQDTNASTGEPFCRNVTITFNQSTTGTLTITYKDAQGKTQTSESISRAGASTAYASAWACTEIVKVTVSAAFTASTTIDVGYDDVFGLPYTTGANTILFAYYDADGADFPATALALTTDYLFTAAAPATTSADDYGTIGITESGSTDPDGTIDYVFLYLPTLINRPPQVPADQDYPTSALDYN